MTLVSVLVALSIIRKREKSGYKLTWVFLILLFPLFGGAFYLIFSFQTSKKRLGKHAHTSPEQHTDLFYLPEDAYARAERELPRHVPQIRYLQQFAGFTIYTGTRTQYFYPGEEFFSALLRELEKAERYILLEFFIIQEGEIWNSILEILKHKAAQGVKVRLIYDDMLNLDVALVAQELQRVLPKDIVELLTSYLDYVSHTSGPVLLSFSLVFTIYFPIRASRGLMDDVRRAYQLPKSSRPVSYILRQLGYTVILLLVIVMTLLLSTLGQRILGFIIEWLPAADGLNISDFLLRLWHYLRFVVAAVIMFAALGALYALAQDHRQPVRSFLPGVIAALVAWLILSFCFSFYVDHFANYSIIYGTLGAVMALLIWLYMTAVILIMGAELNAALRMVWCK